MTPLRKLATQLTSNGLKGIPNGFSQTVFTGFDLASEPLAALFGLVTDHQALLELIERPLIW